MEKNMENEMETGILFLLLSLLLQGSSSRPQHDFGTQAASSRSSNPAS